MGAGNSQEGREAGLSWMGPDTAKVPQLGGMLGSQPTVRVVWKQSEAVREQTGIANSRKPVGLLECEQRTASPLLPSPTTGPDFSAF